jgi:hypothetical protein
MNGACSLLVEAASAVADIRALIWRISRSSVDGCITFSFDRVSNQMTPDFGSAQVGKPQEPSIPAATDCARFSKPQRAISVRKGEPAHLLQPGAAIFPVQHVDELPHDRLHCLIGGQARTMPFRDFFLGRQNGFVGKRGYFAPPRRRNTFTAS